MKLIPITIEAMKQAKSVYCTCIILSVVAMLACAILAYEVPKFGGSFAVAGLLCFVPFFFFLKLVCILADRIEPARRS